MASPFAGLEMGGLPEGAEAEPTPDVNPQGKVQVSRGRVVLRRETAHRGGKAVVVVSAIPEALDGEEIDGLAKELRSACGAGGTVRAREIEIQGDQVARVRAVLEKCGFRVDGERG